MEDLQSELYDAFNDRGTEQISLYSVCRISTTASSSSGKEMLELSRKMFVAEADAEYANCCEAWKAILKTDWLKEAISFCKRKRCPLKIVLMHTANWTAPVWHEINIKENGTEMTHSDMAAGAKKIAYLYKQSYDIDDIE